jgi:hypothetical protein
MQLHMEVGGAILSLADNSEIIDSIFTNNMGYIGGAIFVNSKKDATHVTFQITKNLFIKNIG